jgi:lactoylglutathione lyase
MRVATPVLGLFEAHLPVSNLQRAVEFYRDVVGLQVAHVTPARDAAFLWVGGRGSAMLGLWAAGPAPQWLALHTALRSNVADVLAAPEALRSSGVTPLDFNGRQTDEAIVLGWMPAVAVYFHDPDGHLLEYIAMLPDSPRPDAGVVPWHEWVKR